MVDLNSLADQASARIATVAGRGRTLAKGVTLLAVVTGLVTYLVGLMVIPGGWRWVWAVVGLVLCALPGLATWVATRRLGVATRTVAETSADLRRIATDKRVRTALTELADVRRDDGDSTPLVQIAKDLLSLKSAVGEHADDVADLRRSVLAVTGLPGLMAVGTVGSFMLLGFSALAVLAKVIF